MSNTAASDRHNPGRYGDPPDGAPRCPLGHLVRRETLTNHSDRTALIQGPVIDQAALHGLLGRVRDVGADRRGNRGRRPAARAPNVLMRHKEHHANQTTTTTTTRRRVPMNANTQNAMNRFRPGALGVCTNGSTATVTYRRMYRRKRE